MGCPVALRASLITANLPLTLSLSTGNQPALAPVNSQGTGLHSSSIRCCQAAVQMRCLSDGCVQSLKWSPCNLLQPLSLPLYLFYVSQLHLVHPSALILLQLLSKPYCALPSGQDSLGFESTHSGRRQLTTAWMRPRAKRTGPPLHAWLPFKDILGGSIPFPSHMISLDMNPSWAKLDEAGRWKLEVAGRRLCQKVKESMTEAEGDSLVLLGCIAVVILQV